MLNIEKLCYKLVGGFLTKKYEFTVMARSPAASRLELRNLTCVPKTQVSGAFGTHLQNCLQAHVKVCDPYFAGYKAVPWQTELSN